MNIYDISLLLSLTEEPKDPEDFLAWIQQNDVVHYLTQEILEDDIIVFASLPHVFIHSVLVPVIELTKSTIDELIEWRHSPDSTWSYLISSDEIWIEKPLASSGSSILNDSEQIIYNRSFEGYDAKSNYFDLNQKISQVLEIHYLEERNSWCKLDTFGDIEDIVRVIELEDLPNDSSGTLVTIKRSLLGEYTSVQDLNLCRFFDFTRYKTGSFPGWGEYREPIAFGDGKNLFGRLVVADAIGSYSKGFQIKNISVPKQKVINNFWPTKSVDQKKYVTFIAQDWKHNKITGISCDPSCLGNYFTETELPFETSPAFFRPEVLLKYKSDREKYQLESRTISCRGSWQLKTFDINDAGQVHTYLVYLGQLPYEEQLHWKQYNQEPKAPISERAFKTDFEGQWHEEYEPLENLKMKLREIHREKVDWWTLRSSDALQKTQYPYTASKDEWADEILNLDQLLIEGFEEKWLRRKSKDLGSNPDDKLRALKLVEHLLVRIGFDEDHANQLMSPFHEVHNLRSLLKGHASGKKTEKIRKQILTDFGSYREHFKKICTDCDESMEIIINNFHQFRE